MFPGLRARVRENASSSGMWQLAEFAESQSAEKCGSLAQGIRKSPYHTVIYRFYLTRVLADLLNQDTLHNIWRQNPIVCIGQTGLEALQINQRPVHIAGIIEGAVE